MFTGLDNTGVHEYEVCYGSPALFAHRSRPSPCSGPSADRPAEPRHLPRLRRLDPDRVQPPPRGDGPVCLGQGYNAVNQSLFGALVQYGYQASPWPISPSSAPSKTAVQSHAVGPLRPDRGQRRLQRRGARPDRFRHPRSRTGITPARTSAPPLTAWLQSLRTAFPAAKILYLNIPPTGSAAPSNKANYNADIATVISTLADPLTILADISSLSPFYTCNTGATATATISGGRLTGFTGLAGGTGYATSQSAIPVVLVGGGGTGATAHAASNGSGVVTSVTLDTGGTGYTVAPNVVIGHAYDQVHPNYAGYKAIWDAIKSNVPTYSAGAGGGLLINPGMNGGFQ